MIRVAIVHEIRLMCEMIASSLRDDSEIQIVGCATNLEEARAEGSQSDVILVSSALPNGGALAVTHAFKPTPSVRVVVLGLPESEPAILSFIEAGAVGYVCRENSREELLETIHSVYVGEARVSPAVAAALIARIAELADRLKQSDGGLQAQETHPDLTEREGQVLALVAEGHSNQEIAQLLTIELGTVKNHVHNILRKLNVTSREEAAACLPWIGIKPVDTQRRRRSADRLPERPPRISHPIQEDAGLTRSDEKQDTGPNRYNSWEHLPTGVP